VSVYGTLRYQHNVADNIYDSINVKKTIIIQAEITLESFNNTLRYFTMYGIMVIHLNTKR